MQSKTDTNDCPGFVFRQDGTNELSARISRALNKISPCKGKVKGISFKGLFYVDISKCYLVACK